MAKRSEMGRILLSLAVLLAACAPEGSFGGAVTGSVVDSSGQPVVASVYLVGGPERTESEPMSAPEDSPPAPDSLKFTSGAGRFRIDAPAGSYVLVASAGSEVAYVEVTILDGRTSDLGKVQLAVCNDPQSANPTPCPTADAGSSSAPPESFTIANFVPDYVEVQRNVYPDYEELYVRTESYSLGVLLEFVFPDPTVNTYSASSYDLSEGGNVEGVWSWLTYSDGSGAYAFYLATSGQILVDEYSSTEGGTFSARIEDLRYDWMNPSTSTPDESNSVSVLKSDSLNGTVVVNEAPDG